MLRFSSTFVTLLFLIGVVASHNWDFTPAACDQESYRRFDGTCNNLDHPTWGSVNTRFIRGGLKGKPSYGYNYDPQGNPLEGLPSARLISNKILALGGLEAILSKDGVSAAHIFWGQFLDHDLTFTPSNPADNWPIVVPDDDPYIQYYPEGARLMNFSRSNFAPNPTNGFRDQYNGISAYIDGSSVYGSLPELTQAVRLGENICELNSTVTPLGEMLPRNYLDVGFDNPARKVPLSYLYAAGDVRANENPGLTSLHTIFVREHNRLCREIRSKNPNMPGAQQFQEARRWVIAFLQQITFNEYVPSTLGGSNGFLPVYNGYDPSVDASIDLMFASALFRYGHTEVLNIIPRTFANGTTIPEGHLPLKDCYFNPRCWEAVGPEPILSGMANHLQGEVDAFYADSIRNFLFGQPSEKGINSVDLGARNIQRGRDHGIPSYNQARQYFGLSPAASFSDITSNASLAAALSDVYLGNVSLVDTYIGGLAEDHTEFTLIGSLMGRGIIDQYTRLRDGDRYYFENTNVTGFTPAEIELIKSTRLSDIVLRNSRIPSIQCNMFSTRSTICSNIPDVPPPQAVGGGAVSLLFGKLNISWALIPTPGSGPQAFNDDSEIEFTIVARNNGTWAAVAFSATQTGSMPNADHYSGWVTESGVVNISDYKNGPNKKNGCNNSGVCLDTNQGGVNNVLRPSGSYIPPSKPGELGIMTLKFARKFNTHDPLDIPLKYGPMTMMGVMGLPGAAKGAISYHDENKQVFSYNILGDAPNAPSTPQPVPIAPVPVPTAPHPSECREPSGFAHQLEGINANYKAYWTLDTIAGTLTVAVTAKTAGWVGFGIADASGKMVGSEAVIGWTGPNARVGSYLLKQEDPSGIIPDLGIPLTNASVCNYRGSQMATWTRVDFVRPVALGKNKISIESGSTTNIVAAFGTTQGIFQGHGSNKQKLKVDLTLGSVTRSGPDARKVAHGVLMFISWGIVLQAGALFARYAKPMPNALWFKVHRIVQFLGLVISIVGFILAIIFTKPPHFKHSNGHGQLGLTVMILGILQMIGALFRPNPASLGQAKSIIRVLWEFTHWWMGRIALIMAIATIFLGLQAIGAPYAYTITWAVLVGLASALVCGLELYRKFAIDRPRQTYEFIKLSSDPTNN